MSCQRFQLERHLIVPDPKFVIVDQQMPILNGHVLLHLDRDVLAKLAEDVDVVQDLLAVEVSV
jgi:hypothetical protein